MTHGFDEEPNSNPSPQPLDYERKSSAPSWRVRAAAVIRAVCVAIAVTLTCAIVLLAMNAIAWRGPEDYAALLLLLGGVPAAFVQLVILPLICASMRSWSGRYLKGRLYENDVLIIFLSFGISVLAIAAGAFSFFR